VPSLLTKVAHQVTPGALTAGRQRGKYETFCGIRVGAATIVKAYRMVHSIFNMAVDDQLIRRNP
jgi:hypothetical protein